MKMPAEKYQDCRGVTDITYGKQEKQALGNQKTIAGY